MESRFIFTVGNLKKSTSVMAFLFVLSIFLPVFQVFAVETNFYDGPGGYMEKSYVSKSVRRDLGVYNRIENDVVSKQNKLVGMALGGAVGGGLVLALGIAASPILAAVTVIGSVLAGGYIGSQFSSAEQSPYERSRNSSDFMTWAGGLAGGLAGFMLPGGSVIGATLGAGLGAMAGNAFSEKNRIRSVDYSRSMIDEAMMRMGGGFVGPMGAMMENGSVYGRMTAGQTGMMYPQNWYGRNGNIVMGRDGSQAIRDETGQVIDWRTHYVWHDDNGDLAYPGWENDIYKLDNSFAVRQGSPEWTTGIGSLADTGYGSSVRTILGAYSGNESAGRNSSEGSILGAYGDDRSSDGGWTTGRPAASSESQDLTDLFLRYQQAVQELRNLSEMNASADQKREALNEVRQLEAILKKEVR